MASSKITLSKNETSTMINNLDYKYADKNEFEKELSNQKDINIKILESVQLINKNVHLINKNLDLVKDNEKLEVEARQLADKQLENNINNINDNIETFIKNYDYTIQDIRNDITFTNDSVLRTNEELFNLRNLVKNLKYAMLGLFILVILEHIGLVAIYSNLDNRVNNITSQYNIEQDE